MCKLYYPFSEGWITGTEADILLCAQGVIFFAASKRLQRAPKGSKAELGVVFCWVESGH